MNRTSKLSLLIAVLLLLQVSLTGWSGRSQQAEAAASGPVAISLSPADDLTNVPISAHLQMIFDENVVRGPESTTVSIREYATGRVLESISMTSSRVSIDSTKRIVTIALEKYDAAKALALNTEYYVLVDAGALLNESNGLDYAGIEDASKWNFRTVAVNDVTRPLLKSKNPETNSPVHVTTPITLTFDEPVYAASGNILISSKEDDDTRTIVVTSSAVSGSGSANNKIVIQPPAALQPSKRYTVTIPGTAFRDAAGNFYLGTSWEIETGAAPVNLNSINPLSPADNATSVKTDASLTITFDRNVQARSNKLIEIRRVSNNSTFDSFDALNTNRVKVTGNEVKIVPSKSFEPNTAYYVLIAAGAFTQPDPFESEWYHGISGANIWNFTTDPGTEKDSPYVKTYSPLQNGVSGNTSTLLQLTFNEPVYPSNGNIEIRESATGNLFRSIPIISERVTGGGTYQLTIDPNRQVSGESAKAFVNNKRYYVTIGNQAIRDAAHNYYLGITSNTDWAFTITQDTVKPTLSSISPVNNTTAVRENATFVATFSEAIQIGPGVIKFYQAGTSANSIDAKVVVDVTDNKKLLITPTVNLLKNTSYYIYIPDNGVTDLVGNPFVGILNEYQWTFKTIGADTTPPNVSRIEAVGNTLRLIYNEELNTGIWPSVGSFYVTVNGAPRTVTATQVVGDTVLLTLSSGVVNGQAVKVSYTKEASGRIRDLSDNEAPSFSSKDVGTGQDSTVPRIISGYAYGSSVTLSFNKELMPVNSNAYLQFMVNVGGVNYTATSISNSGSTVTLTINGTIQGSQYVWVSFVPSSYPLRDLAANNVGGFSNFSLTGSTTPPIPTAGLNLQYISASGTAVILKYDKVLNPQYVPSTSQYTVLVDNVMRVVSQVVISGDSVLLNLSTNITAGQKVIVSYVAIGNTLLDMSWNAALSFNAVQANGGSGTGQPGTLVGAILKGSALTLTFSEVLNPASIPNTSLFFVRINDLSRMISRVDISGTTAILTLASPASVGDRASVSYFSNASGLKTISGLMVNSISNENVANQTTLLDSLSGDYEGVDGGVGLKTSASTITTDISAVGNVANRYTVMNDKFIVAYQTARAAGLTNPRVVFKVPAHERAAIVAIPVIALDMANKQGGNTIFAVEHGDVTYEFPLKAVNFTELSGMLNGNGVSNQILIEIDQGASTKSANLSTMLNSVKAQVIAGPVHFEVSLVNGSQEKILTDFNSYISRTIKTSLPMDTSQMAVVWYDSQAGALSYVPTEFTSVGGKTVATFKRKGNSAYALVRSTSSFTDVSKHWAAETINTMARKYIVEGKTTTKFEPDKNITRGEFATYIAKGLGLQGDKTAAAKFKDVTSNTVMGAYIGAAVKAGIVKGNTDGTFKPNNPITRQDMAAMMMRAAKVAELTVSPPNSTASYLQNFTDKGKISSYAKTDVAHAVYLGIITGKNAKTLSPLTNATRAEGTVMLMRLLEKAKFLTP